MATSKKKTSEAAEKASEELEAKTIQDTQDDENVNGEALRGSENAPDGSKKMDAEVIREAAKKRQAARIGRENDLAAQQSKLLDESSLRVAMSRGQVFNGEIIAVETMEFGNCKEVVVSILLDRNIRVIIPFGELLSKNPIDMSTVDESTEDGRFKYLRRKRQFAEKMIGGLTSFCITNIFKDENGLRVLGSRVKAMRKANEYFFTGKSPRYKVGDICEGIVTSVSVHSLVLLVGGVDVVLTQSRLTLRWMEDLHDYYDVGDTVRARITEINVNGEDVSLVVDPIAVELEDAKERQMIVSRGATVRGIVTNVYGRGDRIYIYAWLPRLELPARILHMSPNDFGKEITAGTTLRLRVAGHDENGRVICVALSEHGNMSMFNSYRPDNRY